MENFLWGKSLKNSNPKCVKTPKKGLTLIELVVVVLVITFLVLITLPFYGKLSTYRAKNITLERFDEIRQALLLYYSDHLRLPTSLAYLVTSPIRYGIYLDPSVTRDGWGRQIVYTNCGWFAVLTSAGRNGIVDSSAPCLPERVTTWKDDIVSLVSVREVGVQVEEEIKTRLRILAEYLEEYFRRACEGEVGNRKPGSPVQNYFPYCLTELQIPGYPEITSSFLLLPDGSFIGYIGCATSFTGPGCDSRGALLEGYPTPNSLACADFDFAGDTTDPAYEARVSAVLNGKVFVEYAVGFCRPENKFRPPYALSLATPQIGDRTAGYDSFETNSNWRADSFGSPGIALVPEFYFSRFYAGGISVPQVCSWSFATSSVVSGEASAVGFCALPGVLLGGMYVPTYR